MTVRVDLAVALADRLTDVGLRSAGSFPPGKNSDSATVPAKLLMLVTVTMERAEALCPMVREEGLIVTKKVPLFLAPALLASELTIAPPAMVPRAAVRTISRDFRWMMLLDSNLEHYPQDKPYRPLGGLGALRVVLLVARLTGQHGATAHQSTGRNLKGELARADCPRYWVFEDLGLILLYLRDRVERFVSRGPVCTRFFWVLAEG